MGWCDSNLVYSLLITFTSAVIAYNIIVSSRVAPPLRKEFRFPSSSSWSPSSGHVTIDPIIRMPSQIKKGNKKLFHTAVTSSDSVYNTWQCRIMYYWFKKHQNRDGSEMGGFTRILHSGKPDKYMNEIPTFVADPSLLAQIRRWWVNNRATSLIRLQGYIVLNRPWAFVQWLRDADIKEDYILMAEPDHLIVKPIPNLSKGGNPAAFPFFYIDPKKYEQVLRKFFPENEGSITNIDPIGNSPAIIEKASLKEIASTWMNVSLTMKKDPETDKAFGWVLEMYAYAVASALHGIKHVLYKDFMIQPPWDKEIDEKFIIHYTYGCDFDLQGKMTPGKIGEWRFDKRSYDTTVPPRNLPLPPAGVPESVVVDVLKKIMFFHQDETQKAVTYSEYPSPVMLVKMVNEATSNLPDWEA